MEKKVWLFGCYNRVLMEFLHRIVTHTHSLPFFVQANEVMGLATLLPALYLVAEKDD